MNNIDYAVVVFAIFTLAVLIGFIAKQIRDVKVAAYDSFSSMADRQAELELFVQWLSYNYFDLGDVDEGYLAREFIDSRFEAITNER